MITIFYFIIFYITTRSNDSISLVNFAVDCVDYFLEMPVRFARFLGGYLGLHGKKIKLIRRCTRGECTIADLGGENVLES